ncbi:MAG TPA: helix-turn-helix transcriptional regulator, partial [Micromonosporaceae bacterium]|nr:helix-turn-helix transcriptional regulator [Micromonosporaceae bacterium]
MVCLRTPWAEQVVANAAAQLGLSDVISTASSGAEALARMARSSADIFLVDTAAVRPDTVGFTKRVLERSPGAVLVFFGPEDPEVARAAIAAGARGLIRGGEREDLCASVAKALMLLLRGNRPSTVPLQRSEGEAGEEDSAGVAEA